MNKVLITARVFYKLPELIKKIKEQGAEIVTNPYQGHTLSEENLLEIIGGVDAVICGDDYFTAKVMKKANRLKVISKFGVGVDRIDIQAANDKGITVTNCPGSNKHAVADMTIGLMLSVMRHIPKTHNEVVYEGRWRVVTGTEAYGKTLGIIGLGAIGREVAKRAKGFDMKILAYDPYPDMAFVEKLDVALVSMEDIFRRSNIVSVHLPSIPGTKGIINKDLFNIVKDGIFFINTARGDVINDRDLYDALQSGQVLGAGLDVMSSEPPERDHFLFGLDNVIVTSHIGAHTIEAQRRAGNMAIENAFLVLNGQEPLFRVKGK
ncbi:MAG: phosphoglycerate dehydrogenase [Clostridia bacterium]|nr:phosphoglycerate dehydrogenase [Clostridia bacterium]